MEQHSVPRKILEWRPIGRKLRERPRKGWIEDAEEDLRSMVIRRCRRVCSERVE